MSVQGQLSILAHKTITGVRGALISTLSLIFWITE